MSDDDLRKELHNVKSRAVIKIRTLTERIDSLEKQLEKQKQRSPPESASSEEGAERFEKVDSPNKSGAAAFEAREASLLLREQAIEKREQELAAQIALGHRAQDSAGSNPWHGALLVSLQQVHENLMQVDCACDAAGV